MNRKLIIDYTLLFILGILTCGIIIMITSQFVNMQLAVMKIELDVTNKELASTKKKLAETIRLNIAPEKFLESGVATLQLSMGTVEEMEVQKVNLIEYLSGCVTLPSAEFCVYGLEKKVDIIKENNLYFLVIKDITLPEVAGLCDFMYNNRYYNRWARGTNHSCREHQTNSIAMR